VAGPVAAGPGLEPKQTFQERLMQAGFYRRLNNGAFLLVRAVTLCVPLGMGIAAAYFRLLHPMLAILLGAGMAGLGAIAPSFWLDHLKRRRQVQMRRALPDALDAIVVCLEGGLTLNAAMSRVATEMQTVHPLLAMELKIAEREVQMGRSTGEALQHMARRFDLEELRSMAMVISQSDRFGASVGTALAVFAETMRTRRGQRAEELAHKAVVKIIFPTMLCIFPAIFVVVLGPAVIQMIERLGPVIDNMVQKTS
jgi:tight adherence protein C